PAIGDTDPIRYRRPTPDGQFSGNIIDEAMRPFERRVLTAALVSSERKLDCTSAPPEPRAASVHPQRGIPRAIALSSDIDPTWYRPS
ncbi:MAG: hypothetical protein JWP25_8491, partial [Bradyrhizobium sp.]|nr:hypothetical protein [Bradyrhizobium sp.]